MIEKNGDDHLDHSFDIDLAQIKSRAVRGIAIIAGRGFVLNIISQISIFFLLTFMSPEQMGVFWVVNAAVFFLIYFSDIGLAAALIQKKEKPTEIDFRTTFTVQQILIIFLLIVLYILTPNLVNAYDLTENGRNLIYALGFSLFLASLKSIPTVKLERRLEFGKMAIPDLLESFFYSIFVVYFAWRGFGVNSFTYAVIIRAIIGVVAMYILMPWRPGFAFSRKSLKELFQFGVPYQLNTLISVFKDRGMTLIIGKVIGTAGVGFIGTAERFSQMPLRLFMDPVTKVTFPAFSRMQDHKKELAEVTTRTIFFITFLTYPVLIGMVLVLPVFIEVFPRYEKWEPSVIPLFYMSINVYFAAATTLLTNLLAAIGKIKTVTKLITMWTVLTIILVPTLGWLYGVNGAAAGYALVGTSSIVAIYIAKKHINFSLIESIIKPTIATLVMAISVLIASLWTNSDVAGLILLVVTGAVSYILISYAIFGNKLYSDVKKITKAFAGK